MDLGSARRILVCVRWGIGDLVMELPLLRALRRHAREAHISALAARPAVELLENETVVDHVAAVQDFGLRHWGDAGDASVRRDVARWCAGGDFDCVLDGSHAPLGVRLALGRLDVPWYDTGEHLPDVGTQAAEGLAILAAAARVAWGISPDGRRPRLTLHAGERAAAHRLKESVAGKAPLVGIAPIASSPLKRASATEFARAADALAARTDGHVLLFGSLEGGDARRVLATMSRKHRARIVEPVHLRFTAALLEQCRVLICNDTGLMHVAAAVGVPVVGVFSCTSPALYLPPGGTAVQRWAEPCRHLEVARGRFGVTPCIAAGRCLERGHRRTERWADAAVAAAASAVASRWSY
jgi:ADP-heptose:LPS heptosyltransferase